MVVGVRECPGDTEIVTIKAIAQWYGISLMSFRTKHLENMKKAGYIYARVRGRGHRTEWFAKESNLKIYAMLMQQAGKKF